MLILFFLGLHVPWKFGLHNLMTFLINTAFWEEKHELTQLHSANISFSVVLHTHYFASVLIIHFDFSVAVDIIDGLFPVSYFPMDSTILHSPSAPPTTLVGPSQDPSVASLVLKIWTFPKVLSWQSSLYSLLVWTSLSHAHKHSFYMAIPHIHLSSVFRNKK